jgi:hypothetical protein
MSNRNELLRAVIEDPRSTDAERLAAQDQLSGSQPVTQEVQDKELETVLAVRTIPHRAFENRQLRRSLSPTSQKLLDDITLPTTLLIVPDAGTEERLKALLMRTGSEAVKTQVLAALTTIKWLLDREKTIDLVGTEQCCGLSP